MTITSKNNPHISALLTERKNRDLVCLDTPKLISEAISSGVVPKAILVEEGKNFDFCNDFEVIVVSKSLLKAISSVEKNAGVLAFVEIEKKKPLKPPQHNFLVLDSLQDPGNIGTLIRTGLGANFVDIFLVNCAKLSNEKIIRSSMGAVFKTNCFECSKEEFIALQSNWKTQLVCADMNGQSVFTYSPKSVVGIVLGNEGKGITEEMRKLCSETVSIPMNNGLESLNVAVSGAIIMYEISNK